MTNLKELAIHNYFDNYTVVDSIPKLTSLQTLVLNRGYHLLRSKCDLEDESLDVRKLTALSHLKTLLIEESLNRVLLHDFPEYDSAHFDFLASIKWQTSLQRIIHNDQSRGTDALNACNSMWIRMPIGKLQVGEAFVANATSRLFSIGSTLR